MRIYLLSEGTPNAPTETVKSVHTTLVAAVGYADEIMNLDIGAWDAPVEISHAWQLIYGFTKMWPRRQGGYYITEWETKD